MTSATLLICTLAVAAVVSTGAHAQNTRAEVKAEAVGAAASRPQGELTTQNQVRGPAGPVKSNVSRETVKAETKAARKDGRIAEGERNSANQGKGPAARPTSNTTRAAVKAEAAASGGATSRGEVTKP